MQASCWSRIPGQERRERPCNHPPCEQTTAVQELHCFLSDHIRGSVMTHKGSSCALHKVQQQLHISGCPASLATCRKWPEPLLPWPGGLTMHRQHTGSPSCTRRNDCSPTWLETQEGALGADACLKSTGPWYQTMSVLDSGARAGRWRTIPVQHSHRASAVDWVTNWAYTFPSSQVVRLAMAGSEQAQATAKPTTLACPRTKMTGRGKAWRPAEGTPSCSMPAGA